jgi:uncharacterized protein (TIGR00288 family)
MTATLELKNIALFIDFENFGEHDDFDAHLVVERLKERGRLTLKRAYADWGRFARHKRQMLENSIDLIEMPSHGQGKNSADIKLVVDALDTAITKSYIDTIVVVSGDSDYTPLISKLREYNKYVIVIGSKGNVSRLLVGYCDELIYYASLAGFSPNVAMDIGKAFELLLRAVKYLTERGIETNNSVVKNYMKQLDASFDEANYGFSQFKLFLEEASKRGLVVLRTAKHGQYVVMSPDAAQDAPVVVRDPRPASGSANFTHLLAAIRRYKAQVLVPKLQRDVLNGIHNVLHSAEKPLTRGEVIDRTLTRLEPNAQISELSRTKVGGILKIVQWGGCLEITPGEDEAGARIALLPGFVDPARFIHAHDCAILRIAAAQKILLTPDEVAVEILGDASQLEAAIQLLQEATESLSTDTAAEQEPIKT